MPAETGRAEFPLWGGYAVVLVTEPDVLPVALAAVERTVAEFDAACSSFREDSELIAVNSAAGTPVRVGPVLIDAVQAALRGARATDGDLDPTVGDALLA